MSLISYTTADDCIVVKSEKMWHNVLTIKWLYAWICENVAI
jgi:hypothetical protein